MSEPEPPQRPQYGEYATPEEQRARIQVPAVQQPTDPPAAPPAPSAPQPLTRSTSSPRLVDRIVTWALLGYGLFTVVSALPGLVDAPAYTSRLLSMMGVTATLSDPASVQGYAVAAVVTLVVLWLLATSLSWLGMRRGRLTWWIPLVVGIVANLATGILLAIPLYADPAVRAAILSAYGAG